MESITYSFFTGASFVPQFMKSQRAGNVYVEALGSIIPWMFAMNARMSLLEDILLLHRKLLINSQ